MSRPKKATVDYFPHYVDHGKTMFTIESKYGNNGYSFWFKLLEILGKTEHHFLDCNDIETWEFLLAKTRFSEIDATEILNLCSRLNAINPDLWEMKIVRSENFIDNLNTVYQRRRIDVMDIPEIRDYCIHKYQLNGVSVNINPQSKVKYSKGKESIVETTDDFDFEKFWNLYDKKVGDKKKILKKWSALKQSDRDKIFETLPVFLKSIRDKQYQPYPETYLNNHRWEDEIAKPEKIENGFKNI